MNINRLFILFFFLSIGTNAFSQKGLYPLTIIAKDDRSGSQFNANYTVKSLKTNIDAKVEYKDSYAVAYVQVVEKYQIIAVAEGYGTKIESITIEADADPKDARTKNISMTPKASAYLMVKAIDDKTEEVIPASFKVIATSSKKNYEAATTKEKLEKRVVVSSETPKDEVTVEGSAPNYEVNSEKVNIEMKDPAQNYAVVIRLKKGNFKTKIRAVDSRDKAVPRTRLIVREVGAVNPVVNVLDPPNGEVVIVLNPDKNYRLNIEAPGYNTIDKTFPGKEAITDWTHRLMPKFEAYYKVKAMSGGKRIPAIIKVSSSKNGQLIELPDTDTTSNVKITEQGVYKVEVIAKGYQTAIDDIMVEGSNVGKTTEKIIELEKGIKEYIVKLVDAENKLPLIFGDLKLKTNAGVLVKATKNIQTNDWTVVLQEDGQYTIEAFAPEYRSVKENIKKPNGKVIEIVMSRLTTAMNLMAIDAFTKKPIAAQFKLIRPESIPLEGKTQADGSRFKFEVLPDQKYRVEVTAVDYGSVTEEVGFNSDGKGDAKAFELTKKSYPFKFRILDAQNGKLLSEVKFSALNINRKQEVRAFYQEKTSEREVEMILTDDYQIDVLCETYDLKSVKISPKELITEGFKKDILLNKKAIEKHRITIQDETTKEILKIADVKVLVNSKLVEIEKNSEGTEWSLVLNDKAEYSVEIKAVGYEYLKLPLLQKLGNLLITLPIRKIAQQEVTVLVVDNLTKKPVESTFKLTIDKDVSTSVGTSLKTVIQKDKSYNIEVAAPGYNMAKYAILTNKVSAEPYVISLVKEVYGFTFKAVDVNSKSMLNDAKISVKNLTKNQEVKSKDFAKGTIQVDLKPDFTYEVTSEMKGYDNATIKVDAAMFIGQSFMNEIPMNFRKEPLSAVVKRIEPKLEPKVEEKIEALKPKKVEDFSNLAVGKTIMLDNVYFDQAAYTLRPESIPQLDKLLGTLKVNPKLKIEIIGHTSDEGDKRLNLNLSIFRAKVIANYMFNKGISENRISTNGFGSERPIVANGTEDEKKKNRRVEVLVKEF